MISMTREGVFSTLAVKGTPHCGLKDGEVSFQYYISLTLDDKGLDSEGFVMDNKFLDDYFKAMANKPLTISCESICIEAARHFYRKLSARRSHCVRVCVKVWGLPTAHAEYVWLNPKHVKEYQVNAALAA